MSKLTLRRACAAVAAAALASSCLLAGCAASETTSQADSASSAAEQAAATTRTVVDSNGNEVEIPAEVTKVAPTMGAFAQVTEMLGSGKISAASTSQISDAFKAVFTDYEQSNPESYDSSSVEDIIAAGTQVVYGPASMYSDEQLAQLEQAGVAVVALNNIGTVDGLCESILTIGEILGEDEYANAQKFVEYYRAALADGQKRAADIPDAEKKTVIQMNISGGAYTCADDTDISAAYYDAVGAVNVAAGFQGAQSGQYRSVDAEQLVAWNPDYIITMNPTAKEQIMADAALADVQAVKDGNVYVCPTALYLWCVRSAEGALMTPWLGTVIYPEQYADVDMVDVLQNFYAEFYHTELSDADAAEIVSGATTVTQQGGGQGAGGNGGQGAGRAA
ncbi:MAG: ABC transporter substrate-binding protein [Eggerthellaceae bacterium]|nr:ABC transporter substrate-binding protein [Eggerthellaceae bacterium]